MQKVAACTRLIIEGNLSLCSARTSCARATRSVFATRPSHLRCSSSSSSSSRWQARQSQDGFTRDARVAGLKSRAAFKLLQINDKYKIFQKGATVVDLGFAPGSWSQVAANRTTPGGRVIGVDIIPAQPPRGVSTIQGDFLSPVIQAEVRSFVLDGKRGRPRLGKLLSEADESEDAIEEPEEPSPVPTPTEPGRMGLDAQSQTASPVGLRVAEVSEDTRVVDVVLSDMSEPWEQTTGFSKKSISDPYRRMMNTSGVNFRDHAGSMDLCNAALEFCIDTLQDGGHFVCKFYQGSEDKLLERKLRRMFRKVHRDKPDASRQESREAYFVALRRKEGLSKVDVLAE